MDGPFDFKKICFFKSLMVWSAFQPGRFLCFIFWCFCVFLDLCLLGQIPGLRFRGLHSRPFLRQDKTRLEGTSRIPETVTRLLMSGFIDRENSGKIRDRMELLSTTWEMVLKWAHGVYHRDSILSLRSTPMPKFNV